MQTKFKNSLCNIPQKACIHASTCTMESLHWIHSNTNERFRNIK